MQNRKTRIAIILEVKKRELPFLSILEYILTKEGYDVKLIPFRSMSVWRLLRFRPDIILVNGIRTTDPYFYNQIALPKQLFHAKVLCYYSEQIGYYDLSIADSYKNQLVYDNVDYHIGWGPRFCRDLEKSGVDKEKLWYIGSLQYDIDVYSKKDNVTIKKELAKSYGIDPNKRWILYADNIIKEYQPANLYEQRRMDSFNVVKKVAEKNPDAIILFRPHPETYKEEMQRIKMFFTENKNVIFNNEGHVYYWTASSDATVIWCSTSSLQAMFMNKPIFGFMTSDKQNLERYWYKDMLPLYEDYNKLADDVRMTFDGKIPDIELKTRKARAEYVKEWYFKKDGFAFNRLVAIIKEAEKADFHPLYGEGCKLKTTKLLDSLYYELRAYIGDIVKGRNVERNVSNKEIELERQKYDLTRYQHIDFCIKQSESGKYFE